MTKSIFREYDIRGIYEKELNEQSVKLIGYFLSLEVKKYGEYVAIGYDARSHSPKLCEYLTSGFNAGGVKVLDMGLVATPMNYYSNYIDIDGINVAGSVMITGSHNPPQYNGFKITINKLPFFGDQIYSLGDDILSNVDMEIKDDLKSLKVDIKNRYIEYMVDTFSHLKGMDTNIILDCGNGVAGVGILDIFDRLGLKYKSLYSNPDGNFPNHHPDPSVEENLEDIKKELKGEFELGFAYDGDADRIAVLTKKHNIKGDQLAILFSKSMSNPTVIGEVKCSSVMYDEINKIGKSVMYKTGHSNLKVKIKELDADLAAEVSGHIFFKQNFGFDDALFATLKVLELVKNGVDLDKEIDSLPITYSTEELKVHTTEEEKFKLIEKISSMLQNPPSYLPNIEGLVDIDGLRVIFKDGWGLVRASNTTPVLVTRFESTDKENATLYENSMNKLIREAKKMLDVGLKER